MDTRTMIKELERVEEKHKHDKVFTGQLNVAEMAHDVRKRLEKLKPYEDTGFTPEQIREIDRLYAEKCQEVAELRQRDTAKEPQYEGDSYHEGRLVYDTWICPNCGERYEVEYDIYDFCPKCGQKILWRKADVQESEQTLEKLSAYICDELCCHRNVGADKGDCEMQEICERCELGGGLDEIRKCLSCENSSEITRSSRDNGGWIPVEEKPTEDGFYVATMNGALVDLAEPFVGLAEFEDGEWVDGDDVIAWMPLPEPYCPEKKALERKQEWKERMLRNFLRGH